VSCVPQKLSFKIYAFTAPDSLFLFVNFPEGGRFQDSLEARNAPFFRQLIKLPLAHYTITHPFHLYWFQGGTRREKERVGHLAQDSRASKGERDATRVVTSFSSPNRIFSFPMGEYSPLLPTLY
jgi:hypothetical protein